MEASSLKKLFESQKDELKNKLQGLSLPNDTLKVQSLVKEYFGKLVDSNGDFRLSLTQSEDYILQAAMSLLNAQQDMIKELSARTILGKKIPKQDSKQETTDKFTASDKLGLKKELFPHTIGATAVGGTVGGLVLGTWGAVFGSIAGTALVLYYATTKNGTQAITHSNNAANNSTSKDLNVTNNQSQKIDADAFIKIISNICESLDSLIETFRAQINRVVSKYENQEKPTLESNFRAILEGIQSLIGYERTHGNDEENYTIKIKQRIEDLSELLDNYNLEVVDYTPKNEKWFEKTESPNTEKTKMVIPAIVKDGNVVLKGRIFIKTNNI